MISKNSRSKIPIHVLNHQVEAYLINKISHLEK
jgi:hypothetical protein